MHISFVWRDKEYSEEVEGNLLLSEVEPNFLKDALDKVPSKYAYWATVLASIEKDLSELKSKYELWYAEEYSKVDTKEPKKTEGWKKNQVYLNQSKRIKAYFKQLHSLVEIREKAAAIVKAYDIQSRTLQSLAGIMRGELSMLRAGGNQNLEDI